jgi:hypothetical protein
MAMATLVAARASKNLNRSVTITPYSTAVEQLNALTNEPCRATLVVAAASASGRSLLSVAQLLRHIQKTGGINYLIGLARFASRENLKEVEDNLTRGERPQDHGFFVVERVFLPLGGSKSETTWDRERKLIEELLVKCEAGESREILEGRRDLIRQASDGNVRGLSDNLFWANSGRSELKLRHGFAFFPLNLNPTKATQADVYFTITAVLHARRSARGEKDSLFQQEHIRKVLSPRCFDRFNDGVIQSSLLRAAVLPELDYSIDENISKEMWQVLDFIFRARGVDAGEAYREFLVALALERLRLRIEDMSRRIADYAGSCDNLVDQLLWGKIATIIDTRTPKDQPSVATKVSQQLDSTTALENPTSEQTDNG